MRHDVLAAKHSVHLRLDLARTAIERIGRQHTPHSQAYVALGGFAQSAVDRFKNAAYDLIVEGESYRARLKPKVRDDNPPPTSPVSKPEHPIRKKKR